MFASGKIEVLTMASCKECIHCEVCKKKTWHIVEHQYMYQIKNVEVQCKDFKNKSDFQEAKHGEWLAVPSSDMSTGKAYKCSECQKMRYGVRLPPYCQECGANMGGGKNAGCCRYADSFCLWYSIYITNDFTQRGLDYGTDYVDYSTYLRHPSCRFIKLVCNFNANIQLI